MGILDAMSVAEDGMKAAVWTVHRCGLQSVTPSVVHGGAPAAPLRVSTHALCLSMAAEVHEMQLLVAPKGVGAPL